jgi:catalase-peroxidase
VDTNPTRWTNILIYCSKYEWELKKAPAGASANGNPNIAEEDKQMTLAILQKRNNPLATDVDIGNEKMDPI